MDTSKLSLEEKAFFFDEYTKLIEEFTNPENITEMGILEFIGNLTKIGLDIQLVISKEIPFEMLKAVRNKE